MAGQSPAAGKEVDESSAVALAVAAAPSPTATPVVVSDVAETTQADAESQLTGAGFTVVVGQAESDTAPAGSVISQDPQAGVVSTPGSKVSVVVSTGPPTPSPTTSASP